MAKANKLITVNSVINGGVYVNLFWQSIIIKFYLILSLFAILE